MNPSIAASLGQLPIPAAVAKASAAPVAGPSATDLLELDGPAAAPGGMSSFSSQVPPYTSHLTCPLGSKVMMMLSWGDMAEGFLGGAFIGCAWKAEHWGVSPLGKASMNSH